jgi:hypothetical protein
VTLEQLLRDPEAHWTRANAAAAEAVELLAAALPALPPDYLAFLRASNGGEGPLGVEPGWFQLWPADEVVALNAAYHVKEFVPGLIGFGSSGGGEMFAFGANDQTWGRVFAVPFIPMQADAAIEVAHDFAAFARAFGREPPAG